MGAYRRDVVVVMKIGAYIHGVLILCGCLLSRFYGRIKMWGKWKVWERDQQLLTYQPVQQSTLDPLVNVPNLNPCQTLQVKVAGIPHLSRWTDTTSTTTINYTTHRIERWEVEGLGMRLAISN